MTTLAIQPDYTRLARDIRAIIERGTVEAKRALHQQVLRTNWQVGRYLSAHLPLSRNSGAENKRIIRRLAAVTGHDETYFYMSLKLFRIYPQLPQDTPDWTWSHYLALLSVNDPKKRVRYEQRLRRRWINSMQLKAIIQTDNKIARSRIQMGKAAGQTPQLKPVRGRLYHYLLAGPKKGQANTGLVTIDMGFHVLRQVPADPHVKYHAGMIVRTDKISADGEGGPGTAIQSGFWPKRSKTARGLLYTYKATVERVIDGDTLVCVIDLGFYTLTRQTLRLRGIDCPELTSERGKYARDHVKKLLDPLPWIIVKTYKDDKYGRMLTDVFLGKAAGGAPPEAVASEGTLVNQNLLNEGLAQVWKP